MRQVKVIGTVGYVATTSFLQERFSFSYAEMVGFNTRNLEDDNNVVYYEREHISFLPRGRNNLVDKLRGDWLLMLDADMEFSPDLLYSMLNVMNKYQAPVLSGLYVYKNPPHYPVVYQFNENDNKYEVIAKWEGRPEIVRVDAVGSGCLLVKKFVFDMIRDKLKQQPFDIIGQMGEDMSFFERLRKIGIGTYLAPQIRLKHLGIEAHEYDLKYINDKFLSKPYEAEGK